MFEQDFADAVALLRAEHRRLEQLLAAWEETGDGGRRARLAREIAAEFRLHMLIEQEVFYPAFEGTVAPGIARGLAMRLARAAEAGEGVERETAIRLLAEELTRHVLEEEEQPHGLFASCRASGRDLVALRDLMLAHRDMLDAETVRRARAPA